MTNQEFLDGQLLDGMQQHFKRIEEFIAVIEEENDRLRDELEQLKDMLHKFSHTADILAWLESKNA